MSEKSEKDSQGLKGCLIIFPAQISKTGKPIKGDPRTRVQAPIIAHINNPIVQTLKDREVSNSTIQQRLYKDKAER